jgi:hypothetical protein
LVEGRDVLAVLSPAVDRRAIRRRSPVGLPLAFFVLATALCPSSAWATRVLCLPFQGDVDGKLHRQLVSDLNRNGVSVISAKATPSQLAKLQARSARLRATSLLEISDGRPFDLGVVGRVNGDRWALLYLARDGRVLQRRQVSLNPELRTRALWRIRQDLKALAREEEEAEDEGPAEEEKDADTETPEEPRTSSVTMPLLAPALPSLSVPAPTPAQGNSELPPTERANDALASSLQAQRARGPLQVDGLLDDPDWATAELSSALRQTYPEDAVPPLSTGVRVLYDDTSLYVGVECSDDHSGDIFASLGRRDQPPASDSVTVMLDTSGDRRNGYFFTLTAGSVQADGLILDDANLVTDWDADWEGTSHVSERGWSAELRIPLSVLRFPAEAVQHWRINVRREIGRTRAILDTAPIPSDSHALVSRFVELTGVAEVHPRRAVSIAPYFAARAALRPQYSDPTRPLPRLVDPSGDLGLDLRVGLTSSLTLQAALNPDFGDVEQDEVLLNLTNVEIFLPEKRAFFNSGTDIFQSVGTSNGRSPHMLLYSRRIGLDTPILGAAKLTGKLGPRVEVGVLDVWVSGAGDPSKLAATAAGEPPNEDEPNRAVGYSIRRPFHLGLNDELPGIQPTSTNFLSTVLRWTPADGKSVGLRGVAATPVDAVCDAAVSRCPAAGSQAAAIDFDLRTARRVWGMYGQAEISRATGGPPTGRTLADGTVLKSGDLGYGGYFKLGKLGGQPFRAYVTYDHASPRLFLNQTGFLEQHNFQRIGGELKFVQSVGFLKPLTVTAGGRQELTTDGRGLGLRRLAILQADAVLPAYTYLLVGTSYVFARQDVRELAGVPFQRPSYLLNFISLETNPALPLSFTFTGFATAQQSLEFRWLLYGEASVQYRPHPRLELKLLGGTEVPLDSPFLIDETDDQWRFGDLDARTLSLTFKQLLVLTPRLTFQLYTQIFSGYGRYRATYGASTSLPGVRYTDLTPTTLDFDPSFHTSSLRLSAVLRWEYQLGSLLYLVYSRSQDEAPLVAGAGLRGDLLPAKLGLGPATDIFLLKWSYAWNL